MATISKYLKKIIKRMFLSLIGLVVVLIISYFAFVNYYPSFGGDASEEQKKEYQASSQFKNGKFVNQIDVPKKWKAKKCGYSKGRLISHC